MCGIFGLLRLDGQAVTERELCQAGETLHHRGPDQCNTWLNEAATVGLVHARLSIIDLSPDGNQPFRSPDGKLVALVNGEIYNYPALRPTFEGYPFVGHSDCEVLLPLYQKLGEQFAAALDGMFAAALWDGEWLTLARDPFGKKPLYVCHQPGRVLAFASEIKALYPYTDRHVDAAALQTYFGNGYTSLDDATAYRDIRHIRPGTVWRFRPVDGRIEERAFWTWPVRDAHLVDTAAHWTDAQWIEAYREGLTRAVEKRLMADVPLGAYLSGGIDSSAVVALMHAISPETERHTFSIHFGEPGYDSDAHVQTLVKRFGLRHHRLTFGPEDFVHWFEPAMRNNDLLLADLSLLPMVKLAHEASRHVKVVLTGDGADELLAGYSTYKATGLAQRMGLLRQPGAYMARALARLLPAQGGRRKLNPSVVLAQLGKGLAQPSLALVHGRWRQIWDPAEFDRYLSPSGKQSLGVADGQFPDSVVLERLWDDAPGDWLEKSQAMDLRSWMLHSILPKVDRSTMAFGLEARSPFLDKQLAALAGALPARIKRRHPKWLLRKAVEPYLPEAVVWQPKAGFNTPMSRWFLEEPAVRALVEHWLLSPEALSHGLLDAAAVRKLWRDHAYRDHHLQLWNLLVFNAWIHHHRPVFGTESVTPGVATVLAG